MPLHVSSVSLFGDEVSLQPKTLTRWEIMNKHPRPSAIPLAIACHCLLRKGAVALDTVTSDLPSSRAGQATRFSFGCRWYHRCCHGAFDRYQRHWDGTKEIVTTITTSCFRRFVFNHDNIFLIKARRRKTSCNRHEIASYAKRNGNYSKH